MANPAYAFLTVMRFDIAPSGNPQQISMTYQGIISDGTQQMDWTSTFIYDNTQTQLTNLNNAKDQVVASATNLGYSLTRANVKFNIQFN